MLNAVASEPVEVVKYGLWRKDDPKFGEFVELRELASQKSVRVTLDKNVNGSRPEAGATVVALFSGRIWEEARKARDPEAPAYIARSLKMRVVGFQKAA